MLRRPVLLLAVVLPVAACTSTTDSERSGDASAPSAPGTVETSLPNASGTAASATPSPEDAVDVGSLDEQYEACLLASDFDPEGVQVLIDENGTPWWVKTGHDVPADLHGPCMAQIGGAPDGLSSHGLDATG